jgi:acyl carrier protein
VTTDKKREADLREIVLRVLGEVAPDADTAALEPDDDFRQRLDLDSMDHLNFVVGLHEATGIDIPERDYGKLTTVRGAVAYLGSRSES